jgi:serine/threonine protein kinase
MMPVSLADPTHMRLAPGTRLGPYEILGPLGAGGMGEVYKGRDTRLDRTIAIKILPSADPDRRLRFAREARAVAALSHPHICVLHDVGEQAPSTDPTQPVAFIVIEYLEGESLADRLKAGPLPPDVLVGLALQITDALDAAHGANVIHRDLKPQNIFVTARGQAKVLDFGLAKLDAGANAADADVAAQATMIAERALTDPGTAIGTVAYMSPEQARGDDTDARTDIFSFGAVLYEMATGRPAFSGKTSAVIIDELLNRTSTAPRILNPQIPGELDRIIRRALEKDRGRRYQHASELRADLERLEHGRAAGADARDSARWTTRRRLGAAIAAGVLLVAGGLAWTRPWKAAPPASGPIDSIAVLPFVNGSGTPDADYLSDGLAETLTNSLTRVPGLRVVPRTLAARYKNATVDPREAGAALNARAIVTGRVTQRGDRLMVLAELIDAASVAQLWGDQFDRPLADVLTVQAEISTAIADNLRLHLTREEQQGLTAGTPKDAVAYQLYLKGRYETNKRTRDGYAAATRFFQQAIAQDGTYARAHAGLADVYLWQAYWGYLRPADAYPRSMAAARQALALDDRSADAHASLGWLNLYYLWNWPESQVQYERAVALDPTSAAIRAWYGESLSTRARHDDAINEVRRAAALDPISPQIKTSLAFVLSNARQFDEAVAIQKQAAEQGLESTLAQLDLARLYRLSGQHDLAIALSRTMVDSGDPLGPTFLAASYARAGRRADALAIVRKMAADAAGSDQGAFLVAAVYAALADRDRAFRWLEEAYQERDTFLPWLKVDPEFDSLRGDPRFDSLIRRIGIPDR